MKKECILYDRECIDCGECNMCDLNPKKVCDNCGICIDSGNDYNIMDVDLTTENGDEPLNYHYEDEESENEDFYDEDFEEDFDDNFDNYLDDEDDDDSNEGLDFDFGEFFGQR